MNVRFSADIQIADRRNLDNLTEKASGPGLPDFSF
jgi:hypothetical protein